MYNIKFDVYKGEYELSLPSCKIYYNGEVDTNVLKILETIVSITDSHFQEKVDRHLIKTLKDELKEQIQGQGYKFKFIEGQNLLLFCNKLI